MSVIDLTCPDTAEEPNFESADFRGDCPTLPLPLVGEELFPMEDGGSEEGSLDSDFVVRGATVGASESGTPTASCSFPLGNIVAGFDEESPLWFCPNKIAP